jgi:sulfite exporter TauE/SafE
MNGTTLALFGALTLTGLAGSLHCVGMCGPILVGLSRRLPEGRSFARDAMAYHAGRLWTYAVLGLFAGAFGQRLEQAWGGRSLFALLLGGVVVLNGALMLRRRNTCLEQWLAAKLGGVLRSVTATTGLAGRSGVVARVLVGAVMGLTPCGMVYMALIPAAAIGHPLLSSLGMLAFGLGTLPALTSVVLLDRLLAHRFRRHGRTVAAIGLILAGIWLCARAWPSDTPHSHTMSGAHGQH